LAAARHITVEVVDWWRCVTGGRWHDARSLAIIWYCATVHFGRGSSVGIVTRLRAGRQRFNSRLG
jgi:hypothetical protein